MPVLEVSHVRSLRGPNLWAACAVLDCLLRLPADVPPFDPVLPSEVGIDWPPIKDRADLAQIVARLAIELQRRAGADVSYSDVRATTSPSEFRLIIESEEEELARKCLILAADFGRSGISGDDIDFAARFKTIRELGESICLGPNTRAIRDAARRRGIPVRRLDTGSLLQLGHGIHQRRMCGAETDRTSAIAEDIGWQKPLSKDLLRAVGVPVPEGRTVSDGEDAWRAAVEFGGRIVVKPKSANHGRAVFIDLSERAEIEAAYTTALAEAEDQGVLVERFIPGAEHRVLVVDGRVAAATRGDPLYVIGDGVRTVAALLDEVNRDPRRGEGTECPLSPVEFDDVTIAVVKRQGFLPDSVPPPGQQVLIQRNGNLGVDVTAHVHPVNGRIVALAARTVGLDIAGVDMVVADISRPITDQCGAVLEVNAMPGLMMHLHPSTGQVQPVGDRIVSAVIPPPSDARIPIIAVHGDHDGGFARQVGRMFQPAGRCAGVASSQGTFVDSEQTHAGNRATASAAVDLLLHPFIEAAAIETTETGVAQEGLGFDMCEIAVILAGADAPAAQLLARTVRSSGLVITGKTPAEALSGIASHFGLDVPTVDKASQERS